MQEKNNIVEFWRTPEFETNLEIELYETVQFQKAQILELGRLVQDQSQIIRSQNEEIRLLKKNKINLFFNLLFKKLNKSFLKGINYLIKKLIK